MNYLAKLGMSLALFSTAAIGATCSCASVPLVNSMQAGATEANRFVMSFSYEHHVMNDLVAGSQDVNDETGRQRSSDALLFELGYGINQNWSVSLLTNYIQHERKIGLSGDGKQTSEGLGDSVVLIKYVPKQISVFNQHEWGIGAGMKLGLGKSDAESELGIRQSQDMQPSTGADGYVIWGYYARAFSREARNTLHLVLNSSFNQENDQGYQIGDDINITAGWQTLLSSDWRFGLGVTWREAQGDERNSAMIPNTGGTWLDLNSTVQYRLTDNAAVRASYRHPLDRDLNGSLQFTTSSAWNIGMILQF